MRLFMDTARMGPACPSASQALCEFARLAAEDPSLYSLAFLRHGADVWPESVRVSYPELARWQGVSNLRRMFAESFLVADPQQVFLANRTAQLVRLAARVMFRQCRHVLTTDMNWPAWQAIVEDEAIRQGRRTTQIPLGHAVIEECWSANDVANHLANAFRQHACDGLFLPAVSNLGVAIPVTQLVATLRANHEVRFVLADAAQAFCQVPNPSLADAADVTIVGCHKWLGAHLPMGVAVAGNPVIAEQLRCVMANRESSGRLHDPLLSLTEQLLSDHVNRYSETVNVTPMLTANAALSANQAAPARLNSAYQERLLNLDFVLDCFSGSSWTPRRLHSSMRSAILLANGPSTSDGHSDPDERQARFRGDGVALTAYRNGSIRLSMPSTQMSDEHRACLTEALNHVSDWKSPTHFVLA